MLRKKFALVSVVSVLMTAAGEDMAIDWTFPTDQQPYDAISMEVGDTVTWNWNGFHNVYRYLDMTCVEENLELVGETTGASYTFVDADGRDDGMEHFFGCAVPSHCTFGMQIVITVYNQGMIPAGLGSDYLDPLVAPPTVYEATDIGPQNMDFDMENNMFVTHAGWIQDRLVHYYKFRMFTPSTYPGVIMPGVGSGAVPLQKIYFVTDSGDFSGVIGMPIIEYHHSDGLMYSDFMVVHFITAPADYTEDMYKSLGDFMNVGATVTATEIVMNIPVVPTDASLQDPMDMYSAAPIQPILVWYKGTEVWTYVFEVTDQSAADFFAWTRSAVTSPTRQMVTGYEISVLNFFASSTVVSAIPIWHVNQFDRGVTVGVNGGGPNAAGMRNVIDMDRPDAGYSPLWQVWWATEMPINYNADEFSNAAHGTGSNGFTFFVSPMFVNCPDIGMVGTEINGAKKETFMDYIDMDMDDMQYIIGSHRSLIMKGGILVVVVADGVEIASTVTNMMGGYEFAIASADIPEGTLEIEVTTPDAGVIRTIAVTSDGTDDGAEDDGDAAVSLHRDWACAMIVAMAALWF